MRPLDPSRTLGAETDAVLAEFAAKPHTKRDQSSPPTHCIARKTWGFGAPTLTGRPANTCEAGNGSRASTWAEHRYLCPIAQRSSGKAATLRRVHLYGLVRRDILANQ
ncbi:MAG: hypothetical protein Q7J57_03840, partial [Gemmobacter sp.]|nr:hypothetical protein [Gemmobacter sp.]